MIEAIFAGLVFGIVHVISGPDHFIALAPSSFSEPKTAFRNSLSWGLGHSSGLIIPIVIAFSINDNENPLLEKFSSYAELLVGFALILVGIFAVKLALGLRLHSHKHEHKEGISHQHLHFHTKESLQRHSHTFSGLGLLHGLAGWRHYVAILPTINDEFTTIQVSIYFISYLIGSIAIMNLFTCLLSSFSLRLGQKFVKRLVGFAGSMSIVLGFIWLQNNFILFAG